jgi:hypothetical protein
MVLRFEDAAKQLRPRRLPLPYFARATSTVGAADGYPPCLVCRAFGTDINQSSQK